MIRLAIKITKFATKVVRLAIKVIRLAIYVAGIMSQVLQTATTVTYGAQAGFGNAPLPCPACRLL
jgi:hypothetical protein